MGMDNNGIDRINAASLNQTEVWFREKLFKLAGWMPVLLIAFTGWLVTGEDTFKRWNSPGIALAILAPLTYGIWSKSVLWFYSHCPIHVSIPRKERLLVYMITIGIYFAVLVALALDFI